MKLRPEYEKIRSDAVHDSIVSGASSLDAIRLAVERCQELALGRAAPEAADKQGKAVAILRVGDAGAIATLIADNGKTLPAGEYYVCLSSQPDRKAIEGWENPTLDNTETITADDIPRLFGVDLQPISRKAIEDEVIERCAKLCSMKIDLNDPNSEFSIACEDCAEAIRALKGSK